MRRAQMDSLLLGKIEQALESNPEGTLREIAEEVGCSPSTVHKCKRLLKLRATSEEVKEQDGSVDLSIKNQRLTDSNRTERALFRSEARKLNDRNDLFEKMIELLKTNPIKTSNQTLVLDTSSPVLAIGLSDVHWGETVALPNNEVNTKIISQRLFKFMSEAIKAGIGFGCKRAVFFLTGDQVNSSRRPSEYLSNEFSVSHATVNAVEIYSRMIEIVSQSFSVTDVVSVCGNESRQDKDFGFESKMIMSNYDYIIHESLRALFPGVKFSNWGNPVERLVKICGKNILLTHGITLARKSPEQALNYYRLKHGNDLNYLICGHVHEACNTPFFSRSGSPIGANCFSELTLGIPVSVPSQTFHIISNTSIFSVPVNLTEGLTDSFEFTKPPSSRDVMDTELDLDWGYKGV
jgi:predicted phosphodiesterase